MELHQDSIESLKDSVKKALEAKQKPPTSQWAVNITRHTAEACQLIRINEVSELTTLSKSTIALWVAQGRFPKPLVLSSTVKVWRAHDIQKWIEGHFDTPPTLNNIDFKGELA